VALAVRKKSTFPVPSSSTALTDLSALRTEPVAEVARWEENYGELFAGVVSMCPSMSVFTVVDKSQDSIDKLGIELEPRCAD